MKAHIKLGRILGMEVGLHLSWFIIVLGVVRFFMGAGFDGLLRTTRPCGLVRDGHGIEGIITPHEVIETDRMRWAQTTVEQAMRPLDRLPAVDPETPISEALEIMVRENANELPVAKNGRIEGFLTRGGVMRLLQTRLALEM